MITFSERLFAALVLAAALAGVIAVALCLVSEEAGLLVALAVVPAGYLITVHAEELQAV